MAKQRDNDLPQVVAIASLQGESKLSFVKRVRQELGSDADTFYVQVGGEVLVTALPIEGGLPAQFTGRYLVLPDAARTQLGVDGGDGVAIVQRQRGVALKRVTIEERRGEHAAAFDVETPHRLTRVVQANPDSATIVPHLREKYRGAALRHPVRPYLQDRQTLEAWQARRLLQTPGKDDGPLCEVLIEERLSQQNANGSWAGDVVATARQLHELTELGLAAEEPAIRRGVDWLIARPESDANPGMWFGSDELAARQAQVLAQREAGQGGRFRELRSSEQKRVMAGDDLIHTPCGPRIMWPNALVLRSLLQLGLEGNERVQRALHTMTLGHDWCECGYQHGLTSWRRSEPLSEKELEAFEGACMRQFRYGGISAPEALLEADLVHRSHQLRIGHRSTPHADEYLLRMPNHIQGCEFITTYALSHVRHERVRRYAAAHLWRFAGIQRADGTFPRERHGTGYTPVGILGLYARYEHPAAAIVLMRALPWIVQAQNEDGSWGEGERAGAATCTVLRVLHRLREHLPSEFIQ